MNFEFSIKDIIDIVSMAVVLYYVNKVMKQSRAANIFYGILFFLCCWIVISKVLMMKLLGSVMDQLVNVGAIALIILFQEEIRHFFYTIGMHRRLGKLVRLFSVSKGKHEEGRYDRATIFPIVMACLNMSKQKVGALIIMKNDLPLTDFISTGELIDAKISQRMVENIFFKNSPLHDGAMIVVEDRIAAAACILPISHDLDIPKEFGLRHRAAKGISAETDALAIIVSEETGTITAAFNNRFRHRLTAEELERILINGKF